MKPLPYFLSFTILAAVIVGLTYGGVWLLAAPLYIFVALPIFDSIGGRDEVNPAEADPKVNRNFWHDLPLWLWVPMQLGAVVYALFVIGAGGHSALEFVGIVLSMGIMGAGAAINVAHELMHRRGKAEHGLAEAMLASVTYTHFAVEHILGHHRNVATPNDAASADLGDHVYPFVFKSTVGGLVSAWRLERHRVQRKGAGWLHLGDRRIRHSLLTALAYGTAFAIGGWMGIAFFAAQSAVAIFLLEVINYIEHYGLQRRMLASGKYERVRPEHSWNSAHRVSNYYLFNLARHSDHHYLASREYDRLRHHEDAPQLPTGYAGMVILALFPPLWFRVMDHRVEAWNARGGEAAPQPERAAARAA